MPPGLRAPDEQYGSFAGLVKSKPTLLVRDGKMQCDAMDHERVSESEVRAAVRALDSEGSGGGRARERRHV